MNNFFDFLTNHWDDFLQIYGGVVAVCTVIVKITPTTKDDGILEKVVKVLDYFSTAFSKKDAEKLNK